MKYLEVRRHTMRTKPGKHLSQAGVSLARQVGQGLGPFEVVVTSRKARAYETAIAMGFAVDERLKELGVADEQVWEEIAANADFATWGRRMAASKLLARFGQSQARIWQNLLDNLPENGRALLIGHGAFIEAAATALLPQADHTAWGSPCSYCEGVLVGQEGTRLSLEVLRLPK